MNIANKITIVRILMIPLFLVFLLMQSIPFHNWIAFTIFLVASLTDIFDGYIARKYDLVTNFGKFMDPLADKLLVCSALIGLIELGRIPAWMVILIIFREFVISGFRLVASDNGVVIAASFWGKLKTIVQIVMVHMLIIVDDFSAMVYWLIKIDLLVFFRILTIITTWLAIALTIISLVDYLVKNWKVMKE